MFTSDPQLSISTTGASISTFKSLVISTFLTFYFITTTNGGCIRNTIVSRSFLPLFTEMCCENREQFQKNMTKYFVDKHPEVTPPRSQFDLWSLEEAPEIKSSRPDITSKKLDKKLKKYWEQLDDKQEWERKSKKESQRFLKKMEKRARGKNY